MNQLQASVQVVPVVDPDLATELEQRGIMPASYTVRPLDMLRRLIARRMTDASRDIPHFSLNVAIEVDALLAFRAKFNADLDIRVSVNDLIIKAVGLALQRCPEANVSYMPNGLVQHLSEDVAFAVAMEGGLVTPIVRNAGAKPLGEIALEAKDLAERGRIKRLKPNEYVGGTFTVSNLGMFGVDSFTSIINEPQACILSVGAMKQAYLPGADGPRVSSLMQFTLTCDHRAVDGAIGARLLQQFRQVLETPDILAD